MMAKRMETGGGEEKNSENLTPNTKTMIVDTYLSFNYIGFQGAQVVAVRLWENSSS